MRFEWQVLVQYAPQLFNGLLLTLAAVGTSLLFATMLGLAACAGSLSRYPLARRVARLYTNIFRVIPDIVLIFWMYYCFPLVFDVRMSALTSGITALSLTTGAFLGEVFRAGVMTVPGGQIEAGKSLGLWMPVIWTRIILPQAVRRMAPAFVNTFTELLKHTTLLAGIGVAELTYQAYTLGARTFRQLEFMTVVAIAYFVIIFPLSMLSRSVETRLIRKTGE